jgi:hypothetical protein
MNIWNQPYTKNINEQSKQFKELLFQKLNDPSCKSITNVNLRNS